MAMHWRIQEMIEQSQEEITKCRVVVRSGGGDESVSLVISWVYVRRWMTSSGKHLLAIGRPPAPTFSPALMWCFFSSLMRHERVG